jgi:hypothetical protein
MLGQHDSEHGGESGSCHRHRPGRHDHSPTPLLAQIKTIAVDVALRVTHDTSFR